MGVDHDAPVLAVHRLAVLRGSFLGDLPLAGQRLRPAGQAGADRQHADAMCPGGDHAERRDRAGDGDLEMRIGVRREMQPRIVHLEPVGLHRDRLLAFQQTHDRVHRFQHARTLRARFDAEHVGVRGQRAGPAAQHRAAARHVIELDETLRDQERMVIRQAGHAGPEPDVFGPLGGGGDDQFGQRDQFPAG